MLLMVLIFIMNSRVQAQDSQGNCVVYFNELRLDEAKTYVELKYYKLVIVLENNGIEYMLDLVQRGLDLKNEEKYVLLSTMVHGSISPLFKHSAAHAVPKAHTHQLRNKNVIEHLLHSIVRSATPDMVTKTLVTTFTYMTTVLEDLKTVVNSREQTISNVVTEKFRPTVQYTAVVKAEPSSLPPFIMDTLYTSYLTNTLSTTYTYYNTFTAGNMPVVVTSRETVSNVVTMPAYLATPSFSVVSSLFQSRVFETETYFTTFTFSKTLEEENRVVTTMETVTQVVVTEALIPYTDPVPLMTPTPGFVSIVPSATYFTTYTYLTTSVKDGSTVTRSSLSVASSVVAQEESLAQFASPTLVDPFMHPLSMSPTLQYPPILEKSKTMVPDFEPKTADLTLAYDSPVEDVSFKTTVLGPFEPVQIFATKTYFTTFTYFTTIMGDGTSSKVQSRTQVVSKITTEALSTASDSAYLDAWKDSYLSRHSTILEVTSSVKHIIPDKTESVFVKEPTLVTQSFSYPHYPKDEDEMGILDPTTPSSGSSEQYEELKEGISHIVSMLAGTVAEEYEIITPSHSFDPLYSTVVAPTRVSSYVPTPIGEVDDDYDPTTTENDINIHDKLYYSASHRPTPPLIISVKPNLNRIKPSKIPTPFDVPAFSVNVGAPPQSILEYDESLIASLSSQLADPVDFEAEDISFNLPPPPIIKPVKGGINLQEVSKLESALVKQGSLLPSNSYNSQEDGLTISPEIFDQVDIQGLSSRPMLIPSIPIEPLSRFPQQSSIYRKPAPSASFTIPYKATQISSLSNWNPSSSAVKPVTSWWKPAEIIRITSLAKPTSIHVLNQLPSKTTTSSSYTFSSKPTEIRSSVVPTKSSSTISPSSSTKFTHFEIPDRFSSVILHSPPQHVNLHSSVVDRPEIQPNPTVQILNLLSDIVHEDPVATIPDYYEESSEHTAFKPNYDELPQKVYNISMLPPPARRPSTTTTLKPKKPPTTKRPTLVTKSTFRTTQRSTARTTPKPTTRRPSTTTKKAVPTTKRPSTTTKKAVPSTRPTTKAPTTMSTTTASTSKTTTSSTSAQTTGFTQAVSTQLLQLANSTTFSTFLPSTFSTFSTVSLSDKPTTLAPVTISKDPISPAVFPTQTPLGTTELTTPVSLSTLFAMTTLRKNKTEVPLPAEGFTTPMSLSTLFAMTTLGKNKTGVTQPTAGFTTPYPVDPPEMVSKFEEVVPTLIPKTEDHGNPLEDSLVELPPTAMDSDSPNDPDTQLIIKIVKSTTENPIPSPYPEPPKSSYSTIKPKKKKPKPTLKPSRAPITRPASSNKPVKVYSLAPNAGSSDSSPEEDSVEAETEAETEAENDLDADDDNEEQDDHKSGSTESEEEQNHEISARPPPIPPTGTGPSKTTLGTAITGPAMPNAGTGIATTSGVNWGPLLNIGALGLGGLGASTIARLGLPMLSSVAGYMKSAIPLAGGLARNDTHHRRPSHHDDLTGPSDYSHHGSNSHPMGPNFVKVGSGSPPTKYYHSESIPRRPIVHASSNINNRDPTGQFHRFENGPWSQNKFPPHQGENLNNFQPPHNLQPNIFNQLNSVNKHGDPPKSSEIVFPHIKIINGPQRPQQGAPQQFRPTLITPQNNNNGNNNNARPGPTASDESGEYIPFPRPPSGVSNERPLFRPQGNNNNNKPGQQQKRPAESRPPFDIINLNSHESESAEHNHFGGPSGFDLHSNEIPDKFPPRQPQHRPQATNQGPKRPGTFGSTPKPPLHHMDKVLFDNKGGNPMFTINIEKHEDPKPTPNSPPSSTTKITITSHETAERPPPSGPPRKFIPSFDTESHEHENFIPPPRFPPSDSLHFLPTPPPMTRPKLPGPFPSPTAQRPSESAPNTERSPPNPFFRPMFDQTIEQIHANIRPFINQQPNNQAGGNNRFVPPPPSPPNPGNDKMNPFIRQHSRPEPPRRPVPIHSDEHISIENSHELPQNSGSQQFPGRKPPSTFGNVQPVSRPNQQGFTPNVRNPFIRPFPPVDEFSSPSGSGPQGVVEPPRGPPPANFRPPFRGDSSPFRPYERPTGLHSSEFGNYAQPQFKQPVHLPGFRPMPQPTPSAPTTTNTVPKPPSTPADLLQNHRIPPNFSRPTPNAPPHQQRPSTIFIVEEVPVSSTTTAAPIKPASNRNPVRAPIGGFRNVSGIRTTSTTATTPTPKSNPGKATVSKLNLIRKFTTPMPSSKPTPSVITERPQVNQISITPKDLLKLRAAAGKTNDTRFSGRLPNHFQKGPLFPKLNLGFNTTTTSAPRVTSRRPLNGNKLFVNLPTEDPNFGQDVSGSEDLEAVIDPVSHKIIKSPYDSLSTTPSFHGFPPEPNTTRRTGVESSSEEDFPVPTVKIPNGFMVSTPNQFKDLWWPTTFKPVPSFNLTAESSNTKPVGVTTDKPIDNPTTFKTALKPTTFRPVLVRAQDGANVGNPFGDRQPGPVRFGNNFGNENEGIEHVKFKNVEIFRENNKFNQNRPPQPRPPVSSSAPRPQQPPNQRPPTKTSEYSNEEPEYSDEYSDEIRDVQKLPAGPTPTKQVRPDAPRPQAPTRQAPTNANRPDTPRQPVRKEPDTAELDESNEVFHAGRLPVPSTNMRPPAPPPGYNFDPARPPLRSQHPALGLPFPHPPQQGQNNGYRRPPPVEMRPPPNVQQDHQRFRPPFGPVQGIAPRPNFPPNRHPAHSGEFFVNRPPAHRPGPDEHHNVPGMNLVKTDVIRTPNRPPFIPLRDDSPKTNRPTHPTQTIPTKPTPSAESEEYYEESNEIIIDPTSSSSTTPREGSLVVQNQEKSPSESIETSAKKPTLSTTQKTTPRPPPTRSTPTNPIRRVPSRRPATTTATSPRTTSAPRRNPPSRPTPPQRKPMQPVSQELDYEDEEYEDAESAEKPTLQVAPNVPKFQPPPPPSPPTNNNNNRPVHAGGYISNNNMIRRPRPPPERPSGPPPFGRPFPPGPNFEHHGHRPGNPPKTEMEPPAPNVRGRPQVLDLPPGGSVRPRPPGPPGRNPNMRPNLLRPNSNLLSTPATPMVSEVTVHTIASVDDDNKIVATNVFTQSLPTRGYTRDRSPLLTETLEGAENIQLQPTPILEGSELRTTSSSVVIYSSGTLQTLSSYSPALKPSSHEESDEEYYSEEEEEEDLQSKPASRPSSTVITRTRSSIIRAPIKPTIIRTRGSQFVKPTPALTSTPAVSSTKDEAATVSPTAVVKSTSSTSRFVMPSRRPFNKLNIGSGSTTTTKAPAETPETTTTKGATVVTTRKPFLPNNRNYTGFPPWSRRFTTTPAPVVTTVEPEEENAVEPSEDKLKPNVVLAGANNTTKKFFNRKPFIPQTTTQKPVDGNLLFSRKPFQRTTTESTTEATVKPTTFRPFRRPLPPKLKTPASTTEESLPPKETSENDIEDERDKDQAENKRIVVVNSSTSVSATRKTIVVESSESQYDPAERGPEESTVVSTVHISTNQEPPISPTRVRVKQRTSQGQHPLRPKLSSSVVPESTNEQPPTTRYITQTETSTKTLTETETTVTTSLGEPVTHTVMITKTLPPPTLVSTIVGSVTVVNTVEVEPTTVRSTIFAEPTRTIPPIPTSEETTKDPEPVEPTVLQGGILVKGNGNRRKNQQKPTQQGDTTAKPKRRPDILDADCETYCGSYKKNQMCKKLGKNTKAQCVCKPGYARRLPSMPCKAIYTFEMSIGVRDLVGMDMDMNQMSNPDSENFIEFAETTRQALDKAFLSSDIWKAYQGASVMSLVPKSAMNITMSPDVTAKLDFLVQLSHNLSGNSMRDKLMSQLQTTNYSIGKSGIMASKSIQDMAARDFNECAHRDHHDCSPFATCINLQGSFTCECRNGFKDNSRIGEPGRQCQEMDGCEKCNWRGDCMVLDNGEETCQCRRWYGGATCQINLKFVLIAIIVLGLGMFIMILSCGILVCGKDSSPARRERGGSGRFLRYRSPASQATLERTAIMNESCSSDDGSQTPPVRLHPHSYTPDSLAHLDGAADKRQRRASRDANMMNFTMRNAMDQDRSLTVVIPRAKIREASRPSSRPTHALSEVQAEMSATEQKLLSYLDNASASANRHGPVASSSRLSHLKADETKRKFSLQEQRKISSGALVSSGTEVSAQGGMRRKSTGIPLPDARSTTTRGSVSEVRSVNETIRTTGKQFSDQASRASNYSCKPPSYCAYSESHGHTMAEKDGSSTVYTTQGKLFRMSHNHHNRDFMDDSDSISMSD